MTVASSSGSTAPVVIPGIVSGINTSSVIQALLTGYQAPITSLENQQSTIKANASDYGAINTALQALLTSAQSLSTTSDWNLMTASSSDTSVASVSSQAGAQSGSANFTVDQLAQGNVLASKAGVSSTGSIVTTASSLLVATGGAGIGFSALQAGGGLELGSHTIDVTQSSSAATVTGSSTLPTTTAITSGANDTLDLNVGGTAYALTLAATSGSGDTPASLVAAINAAATSAGAGVTASLTQTGALELSTNEQGSAASLSITGGDALSSLGLTSGQSGTGTDAVVTVDGTKTTLSAINPGQSVSLAAPTGSITATVASSVGATGSLVTEGTASADVVSTGSGSLADVVSNINNSGLALTASSVEDAQGQYLLQVSANNTGLSGSASVDSSAFSSGSLGGMSQITSAQNALVTVGGTGGYQLSSSTNVFNNILSGTAVTVASPGSTTVNVARDSAGEGNAVATLVGQANAVLNEIQSFAGYNASTKTSGPLVGSSVLDGIQQQILSLFATTGGTSGYGNALDAGISLTKTGTLSFDQTTFESAFTSSPSSVIGLFAAGGSFTPSSSSYTGAVSYVYGSENTQAGSYDVKISQSAAQATATGSTLSAGTVTTGETLSIGEGGASASYTTSAGESLAAIADGLNSQFASQGLAMSASVINGGTQLELASSAYGSAASFTVSSTGSGTGTTGLGGSTAGATTTYTGQDVEGTINGVTATGVGQILTAPSSDSTLSGLSLMVTATGISSSTDLGSFAYSPGVAEKLQTLADTASNASNGTVTTTINGLTAQASTFTSKIANLETIENQQQALLQNEFNTMETQLGSLKAESSQITSAIAGLG